MSELKARMLGQTMNEYGCDTKIYLKSAADKKIEELEKNLSEIQSQKMQLEDDVALLRRNNAELKKQVHDYAQGLYVDEAMGEKESRHHKYKRCLAMVARCKYRIDNPVERDEHDDWLIITEFWERWHKRWLELADKFKD